MTVFSPKPGPGAVAGLRHSLVDAAYEALKAEIRENRLGPGDQGSEGEIAARLGMSRTPVHEAAIRLQEEGLVRVLPRRGIVVLGIAPDDVREIYEVLVALESSSAELLAEKPEADRSSIAADLNVLNDRMAAALAAGNLHAWAAADEQFHLSLVERTGNRRLLRMFHTVMDQSHRARMLTLRLRPRPTASVRQHRAIVEALRRGDAMAARERAKRHRTVAREQIMPLLAELGMRKL